MPAIAPLAMVLWQDRVPIQVSLTLLADTQAGGGCMKSLYQMAALPTKRAGASGVFAVR